MTRMSDQARPPNENAMKYAGINGKMNKKQDQSSWGTISASHLLSNVDALRRSLAHADQTLDTNL